MCVNADADPYCAVMKYGHTSPPPTALQAANVSPSAVIDSLNQVLLSVILLTIRLRLTILLFLIVSCILITTLVATVPA